MASLSGQGVFALAAGLVVAACAPGQGPEAMERAALMDDVLRLNHLQAEGTHNSYHVQSWFPLPQYQYSHAPLAEQARNQGVRKFELDLHYNGVRDRVDVFHVVVIDRRTTCDTLTSCLEGVVQWSDANPDHHPIFFLLEPKTLQPGASPEHFLELMESAILDAMEPSRIITPDEVQGGYATLPRALAEDGWPTLGEVRGRFMFILHDTGELRDLYTHGGEDLSGRLMFVESSPGDPFGAFVIMNDPIASGSAIASAVSSGYIVRTRADSGIVPNPDQFEAALESGAHIISTDFPDPSENPEYYIEIPGGNPSRCNPLTAPTDCTAEDIEDL